MAAATNANMMVVEIARQQLQKAQESFDYEEDEEDVSVELRYLNITQLPLDVIHLLKTTVTKLSLHGNQLSTLPNELMSLERLTYLDLSHNRFQEFPAVLCSCAALEILDISCNSLTRLPSYLGDLAKSLKVLSLSNNQFEYLSPSIADIEDLRFLELENNPLMMPTLNFVKENSNSPDWIDILREYLVSHNDAITEALSRRATAISGSAVAGSSRGKNVERGGLADKIDMSNESGEEEDQDIITLTERIRSMPDGGQLSSRAAKRMGFVVKKRATIAGPEASASSTGSTAAAAAASPVPGPPSSSLASSTSSSESIPAVAISTSGTGPISATTSSSSNESKHTGQHVSGHQGRSRSQSHARDASHDNVFIPTASPSTSSSPPLAHINISGATPQQLLHTQQQPLPQQHHQPLPQPLLPQQEIQEQQYQTLSQDFANDALSGSNKHSPEPLPPPIPPLSRSRRGTLSSGVGASQPLIMEPTPGAYFRRLSTLPEENTIEGEDGEIFTSESANFRGVNNAGNGGNMAAASNVKLSAQRRPSVNSTAFYYNNYGGPGSGLGLNAGGTGNIGSSNAMMNRQASAIKKSHLLDCARKVLFATHEFHEIVRRCSGFCSDKVLTVKMNALLVNSRSVLPDLVTALENHEGVGIVNTNVGNANGTVISGTTDERDDANVNIITTTASTAAATTTTTTTTATASMTTTTTGTTTSMNTNSNDIEREQQEAQEVTTNQTSSSAYTERVLIMTVGRCVSAMRELADFFRDNLQMLSTCIDIKFLRTLTMVTFTSFSELTNAWSDLTSVLAVSGGGTIGGVQSKDGLGSSDDSTLEEFISADEQLYDRIYYSSNAAQAVLGQLTETISRSARVSGLEGVEITPATASKVKDLANTCMAGVDVTRRLKSRMENLRETGAIDRRGFWDDSNGFLKAVIAILGSTKQAMDDLPFLSEARPSLATLTKLAKEIPVLLEMSSYRFEPHGPSPGDQGASADDSASHASGSSGSAVTGSQSQSHSHVAHATSANTSAAAAGAAMQPMPATPLVAVLGPAAHAVMSPSYNATNYFSSFA